MLPVSEIFLQCDCKIKTLEGVLLGSGVLSGIAFDSVQILKGDGFLPTIPRSALVCLALSAPSGESKTLIGKVFLSGPEKMLVEAVQNLSDYERRNFFRVKTAIVTAMTPVSQEAEGTGHAQPFQVKITDLSMSGCFLESRKILTIGSCCTIAIPLYKDRISLLCKVRRITKAENKCRGYGCTFLNNTSRQNDLLCQYLFEEQRTMIKRAREKSLL